METTTSPNEVNFLLKSTYTPTVAQKGVILSLDLQSNISLKSKDKYVLIVLDVSGSMAGGKINTSKEAICEVIKMLFNHNERPKVDLITFQSRPQFYRLQDKNLNECLQIVSSITASGGTNFIPVFEMIKQILGKSKKGLVSKAFEKAKNLFGKSDDIPETAIDELAVIFLSDGQGEPLNSLQPYIKELRVIAEGQLASAEFHTLGFGADHDARLLEEMTKVMPTQGTFQYIKESAEIRSCIEAVSGCLVEKRLSANVSWTEGDKQFEKRANFVSQFEKLREPGMEACWEAVVGFSNTLEQFESIKDTLKLNIKLEEGYKTLVVTASFKKPEGKAVEVRQNCFFINEELKKISDAIIAGGKFDAAKAEEYRNQVAGLRVMLNELVKDVFKVKIDERKMMIEATKDLNEYMDQIGELLRASAAQGLTNDQIASVNALAYRQVTKKSNLKTLDKRALQNVDLLNDVTNKVKEAASKVDEKEFTEKYQTLINEVGCCSMNLTNLAETLKSEDCLCLTFDIARPEVAIQDASRIIVKKIYPTIICATAFLDCIKHSLKLNPNNSGGFDTAYQGNIVKGASNESITAALPLYFCPEHWQVASNYIKPIIGWDVTLDPLGYDYNQIRTVPFLLLVKALDQKFENPNEFNTRVVKWLLDTCCQIIKDEAGKSGLAETIKPIWEKYDTDGTVRGVETVQSNNLLLAYVYCLQEMEILKKDSKEVFMNKIRKMVEEEMRRRQDKAKLWNGSLVRKNLKRIFNIDIDFFVDHLRKEHDEKKPKEAPKEEVKTEEGISEAKIKRLEDAFKAAKEPKKGNKNIYTSKFEREKVNKQKAEENKEKEKDKNKEFKLTVTPDFLEKVEALGLKGENLFASEFEKLEKVQKEYFTQASQSYKNATRFLRPWLKIMDIGLEGIEKVELMNPLELFALFIQNKIHHKNSDRVESFQNNTYVDTFDAEAAKNYIHKLAGQIIYGSWLKELERKPKNMNLTTDDIKFFAETENLEAAAGLIIAEGFDLGSHEYLQKVLRREVGSCKKVLEKLLMLRHKEYAGVQFNFSFIVRKKFARQLYKKYKDRYTYTQWKEIWYREKI